MSNRLAGALSPYLEQHADNPVDWYPWGAEALENARTSDRPILLSIGYSACHWCHVMAHESFEDEEIAAKMNDWFVNIKVDREERPDLDRIYQIAHQVLSGRGGGWPLTVFLDPTDLAPFIAGTYFPPTARHGLIGFGELLERVHNAWLNQRDTLKAQNQRMHEALEMISAQRTPPDETGGDPEQVLLGQLDARRDRRHGGFGEAPKFPQAPMLEWLLAAAGEDEQAADMLGDTLDAIADNGLFDHLGGGFFRYCVDAAWEIPHFEKMLDDNAQLLPVLAEAATRWNNPRWARAAELTAEFLARDFRLNDGGLASSLDADSLPPPDAAEAPDKPLQPEEGAHYVWTPAQFEACLVGEGLELARARFGLDGPANFEGDKWHLVRARSLDELTRDAGDAASVAETLERARAQLLACRQARPAPARDDKMLAGANALAASGLMRAGRLHGRAEWIGLGVETAEKTWRRLFADAPPRAVWRDGRRDHPALLDDHAAMLDACLEGLQCHWDADWLERAEQLAASILDRFFDATSDTLYLTPADHERLIMRPTANTDDATPAGAALAVRALGRLGHLIASSEWLTLAGRIVAAARGDMQRAPLAHAGLLLAAGELERPRPQVLIGGADDEADDWHAALSRRPGIHCYRVTGNDGALPGILAQAADAEAVRAIVCVGTHCLEPATTRDQLEARLAAGGDTVPGY
ncbi:MAG: thioredoxin domain-containing protein [Wenzhouxiangellaceae bacterium]|nr:thioredoxin domain-containing protein [Wenzhouxiangellaceae bacterium]MBS3822270.1 thioredoxin domain-containing protein [Wenzhouxiangellaceae bacterium]